MWQTNRKKGIKTIIKFISDSHKKNVLLLSKIFYIKILEKKFLIDITRFSRQTTGSRWQDFIDEKLVIDNKIY